MPTNLINGLEMSPLVNAAPSELDVVQAVRAASAAGEQWAQLDPAARAAVVGVWIDAVERDAGQLAAIEAAATGVEPDLARRDLARAVADARAAIVAAGTKNRPLGVVGLITARAMILRTILPRVASLLVGGNTVIIKPSSHHTEVVAALTPTLANAGMPPGVVNVVFGPGATLGHFLCEHPGVPAIALTGRTETGRAVAAAAGPQLKRLSLALGAKNAAIVLKDADLDAAVPCLLRAAFARGGVDPFALTKILVAREIATELLARLRAQSPARVTLPTAHDAAVFAKYVALARAENGGLTGGVVEGREVSPAIVSELTHCSEIHQDELLVPLLTVNEIKYAHEGVKWANTAPFGRAAAVFTANDASARKLAGQLNVGTVWINGWFDQAASTGIGPDRKASGFGQPFAPDFAQAAAVVIA